MNPIPLPFIIGNNGTLPIKKYATDAGLDLYTAEEVTILPHQTVAVETDIQVQVPEGFWAIILPRSSMRQQGLVISSVFDAGYNGSLSPLTTNASDKPLTLKAKERFCQLILLPLYPAAVTTVTAFEQISDRQNQGIGSTGKF